MTNLQSRSASNSSEDGFSVGERAKGNSSEIIINDPSMYILAGSIGCGSSFRTPESPKLLVSNGSCKGYLLDYGGTKITATLIKTSFYKTENSDTLTADQLSEKLGEADRALKQKVTEMKLQLEASEVIQLTSAQRDWIQFKDKNCAFECALFPKSTDPNAAREQKDQHLRCIYRQTLHRLDDFSRYQSLYNRRQKQKTTSQQKVVGQRLPI
ncbi:MAG: DUF1311 domain-containing protein [Desulfobacterales bacterium]|nr:DUF1311 domain-containing protein [Desulfobacterales bacterium]